MPDVDDQPLSSSRADFLALRISPGTIETIAWCLLVVAIPLVALNVVCGPWDHDGGFYLQRGYYIASGLKPYLDYGEIYPPLGDIITGTILRSGMSHIVAAIAIPIMWVIATMIATGVLVFSATRDRSMATLLAALAAIYSYENGGNHVTLEHGVAFFSCLAFVPIVSQSRLTVGGAARAVLFATAAILCKQTGLVTLFVALVAFVERRSEITRRHIVAAVGGALILPLAIAAWLRFDFAAIYANVVAQLGNYAAQNVDRSPTVMSDEYFRAPATAVLLLASIAIGSFLALRVKSIRLVSIAATIGVVAEFWPRLMRNYFHYNLNIWPFIVLVLALLLARRQALVAVGSRAALVLFTVLAMSRLIFPYRWAGVSPLLSTFYPAGELVHAVTPPDGVVRQYGSEAIIEFLGWRREELIERSWHRNYEYPTAPRTNTTIVIIESRVDDLPQRLETLRQQGFLVVARMNGITILRHHTSLRRTFPAT